MIMIYGVLTVLLIACLIIQYYLFDGFNYTFLSSLIPNMVITVVGIFLSIFVIDKLLKRSKYKSDIRTIKETLGNQYEQFISRISNEFLYFVLKNPPQYSGENPLADFNKKINDIANNTDKYVNDDFVKLPIKTIQFNSQNVFQPIENSISYQIYCEKYFKHNINSEITEFLGRYISVLPDDVKISIFTISDKLRSNILQTTIQFGIPIDISNAKIDVDAFRKVVKDIAIEIDKLQKLWLLEHFR